MSNSAKIKRGDKMSEQITITMTREELIEIIEKVAIREKFFIRNSVKLSIADAILSAESQKKSISDEMHKEFLSEMRGSQEKQEKCFECKGSGKTDADARGIDGNVCIKCGGTGIKTIFNGGKSK